jgi:flagellar hook-length control protein FliK
VNAEAPQAPVAAVSGKNRKPHGAGTSTALGKGLNKGSTAFQELLSARAAQKGGRAVLTAAVANADAREAAGIKALLAALLVDSRTAAGAAAASAKAGVHVSDTPAVVAEADHSRKSARGKSLDQSVGQVLVNAHAAVHSQAPVVSKEQKEVSPEPAKAPAIDAKSTTHKAEPLVRIVDLRQHAKDSAAAPSARGTEPASADRSDAASLVTRPPSREMPLDASARPAPSSSPSPTPLERLRDMAGSELVRASQLVLKDGGGEIRLVLKPESLGSVRVRMNVVDNNIEGRIIVDSAAVKHVMDGSVDALRRALTAEGFQMGSLQVSVGGQDAQADQRRRQEQAPSEVRRITAQGFERTIPGAEDVSLGDLFVNLFV